MKKCVKNLFVGVPLVVLAGLMMSGCGVGVQKSQNNPLPADVLNPVNGEDVSSSASVEEWGEADGKKVHLYTLKNANGLILKVTDYGCIVTELHVPGSDGELADIVHGFDNLQAYLDGHPYFGAMVGRVANRIGDAKFSIDGEEYTLAANNGKNHLHGGEKGYDKVVWDAAQEGNKVTFSYTSADGEEGYPGTVKITVVYELTDANEFRIEMKATSDKKTPFNLAHHTYWNLGGTGSGLILDHELQLMAAKYTVFDETGIPTGEIADVAGGPLDFTAAKTVGKDIEQIPADEASGNPGGYDHNWVVDGTVGELRAAAKLRHPASGRVMEISSTQPGIQFYTGNYMDGSTAGKGAKHEKRSALCLETQHFPDSINQPDFPSSVIGPGADYHEVMVHTFSVQ